MVTIVDPHIKRDPEYRVFKEAEDRGLYVKNKEGADFDGRVSGFGWFNGFQLAEVPRLLLT